MATWNTDKPAVGNEISADIPDIEENFQELHDVITAITNGTLGTTTASSFAVDSLADGTTGFASTTTQPFYQNSAPTSWTRNAALTDNSMFMYAAAGNVATGGSVDAKAAHAHGMNSHTHSVVVPKTGWSTGTVAVASLGAAYNVAGMNYGITADRTLTSAAAAGNTANNTAPYYIEMILAAVD